MGKILRFWDVGFGMLSGILLIIYSLNLLKVDYLSQLVLVSLSLFFVFALLNMLTLIGYVGEGHITKLAVFHALTDIILSLTLVAFLTNFQIIYLEYLMQLYKNKFVLLGIGSYFFIANMIWVFRGQ
ncbi:MAG: hypothetical protein KKC75_03320 [Nanoarchaeota archaeon]|nr:hypothetical protein [Nanoarchaeota archaeon]MBU1004682.1 hypothetical protein [Nanoarchaeota archaeon]MBU1945807.1 hypothetical protein [Nanoarchaeota archaeon]